MVPANTETELLESDFMTNANLEVVEGPDGEPMYFVRGKEVSVPKMLPHAIITRDGSEIAAFSEGGLRPCCIFTKEEVGDLTLETAETIPDWVARIAPTT